MNHQFLSRRFVTVLTAALLLTLPRGGSAQSKPDEAGLLRKTQVSPGDANEERTLVMTVFGNPLYLEQWTPPETETKRKELSPADFDKWLLEYRAVRAYDHVWGAVKKRYIEHEKIGVSDEEMSALTKSVEQNLISRRGGPDESPFASLEQKGIATAFARASLMDWKVCKSLYEQYGGRVGIGSLGAWTALSGQHRLLCSHYRDADLKFHHDKFKLEFWNYSSRENFADAYPTGERLKQLLATPPYVLASDTAAVEKTRRQRIGSVLGQDIYRDQLKDNSPSYHQVVQLFMAPAIEEFERKHWTKFDMTDEEVLAGVAWMESETRRRGGKPWEHWQARSKEFQANAIKSQTEINRQLDDPATPKEQHTMLRTALRVAALEATHPHAGEVWFMNHRRKLELYLFDNYGRGRIIHQQFGPEALDARRKLLLELEKDGKFEITDPELRKLAYDYWERPAHPGGFHTDRRIMEFPWTASHKAMMDELEAGRTVEPIKKVIP